MSKQRLVAPVALDRGALLVAACGPTGVVRLARLERSAGGVPAAADPGLERASRRPRPASAEASASASGADDRGRRPASQIPATVGDVTLSVTATDGEAYVRANVNRQLAPILTAVNMAPTDVTVATATGTSAGGATLFIDAVQVTGADAGAADRVPDRGRGRAGSPVEAADIGGKSVVKATTSSYTLAVYASGDTLFYVQSPDAALVDQAVAALP